MLSQRDRQAWDRFLAAGWQRRPSGPGRYIVARQMDYAVPSSLPFQQDFAEMAPGTGTHSVYVAGNYVGLVGSDGSDLGERALYPPISTWWWWGPMPELPAPPEPEEAPRG
jgi:hypothetical protein